MDNTKIIHTREIFNIIGTEKIPLGGVGTGHVSTKTLKEWVLQDIAKNLKVDNINNTLDINKPLSKAQRMYIDGSLTEVKAQFERLNQQISNLESKILELEEQLVLNTSQSV